MNEYYFHLDHLTVGYDKKPLIKDICIGIEKGEIVTLIGPNGSGKSTILKSITRQLKLVGGNVEFDGKNLHELSFRELSTKMAVVLTERMKPELMTYHADWFEETGASYPLRISIVKDIVTIGLDTTGESLHKRGYRKFTAPAPVTETLAAAMILLSPWHADRMLIDPFCGSGTIPIEAAMIALNMAPGMNREFTAESWKNLVPKKAWYDAIDEAEDAIRNDAEIHIQGYDIDDEVLKMARANAKLAGVDQYIHFQQRDVADFNTPKKYGFVISNPPYGERLSTKEEMFDLYKTVGRVMSENDTWSFFLLSGYEDAQKAVAAGGNRKKATKNRKIYNGMMKTYLYQYMGEKPPARRKDKKENE